VLRLKLERLHRLLELVLQRQFDDVESLLMHPIMRL
jgi:hypothetical protein